MTDFIFPGSVGVLAAVLFVVTELILLPLFEQARECLTAAYLRNRIANGDSVWLGCENKLVQWFGLSDGVYMAGRGLALPRFLKMFLKLAFLVSCFMFDFSIESAKVATKVTYHFNGGGAYVIAPIPVDGLRYKKARTFGEHEKMDNLRHDLDLECSIDFLSWCTSMRRHQNSTERFVYLGIINASDRSLVCLNGTEGRNRGIAFSYNPDISQTNHSRLSSIKLISLEEIPSKHGGVYYAEVILEGTSDVHRGYILIWVPYGNSNDWRFYGLFVHSKRETILRLDIQTYSRKGMLCNQTGSDSPSNDNWLGNWTIIGGDIMSCPNRSYKHVLLLEFTDIQDVNFRLGTSDEFILGTPLEVIRTMVLRKEAEERDVHELFVDEVRDTISKFRFYISGAKNDAIELKTGPTVEYAKIARCPTIALCISVVALLMYFVVSFIVDFRSKKVTSVSSNILSRDACIRMLHDEAVEQDLILESKKFRFPVELTSNFKYRVRARVDRSKMTKTSV